MAEIQQILAFVALAERLKRELRHSWLSDGRQESVAEHSWMMALLAVLLHARLDEPVDIRVVLMMVIVHDLIEAVAGDIPYFEDSDRKRNKAAIEAAAMVEIRAALPVDVGDEVARLWEAFEKRTSLEAKFAVALDNIEVQIQHNLAPFSTWLRLECDLVYRKVLQPCAYDSFLAKLAEGVIADAEVKMTAHGVDVAALRAQHAFSEAAQP
jgi:putative hydrolase of HD superfamily